MVAGALVTGVLALAIIYNINTVTTFNKSKQEVLVYTYDICEDKLEHYVNKLDNCLYLQQQLLAEETNYRKDFSKLNKKYIQLLNKYNHLKKELEEKDRLLLDLTTTK